MISSISLRGRSRARSPWVLLCLAVALSVLAAACGGGDEPEPTAPPTTAAPPATATEAPTPTPTSTPTPTPTPTEEVAVAPLTGAPIEDEARLALPALGVKVDNAPAARPQLGLNEADIVFEELVEGGVTRFLAVYHSVDPGDVGPVRSGREVDADLFPPFAGVLAISGAAGPTYNVLFSAGLTVFEEGQAGGAIYRVGGRPAPHNLNADASALWEAGASQPAATQPWPIDAAVPEGGTPVRNVDSAFSEDTSQSWAWRPASGLWERGQNGTRHTTLTATGEEAQVQAENIVYATVEVRSGGGVDVSGAGTVAITLVSSGEAVYFRDGQRFEGTWRKTARENQFEWLDSEGRPFPLAPGRTWVELIPTVGTLATDVESPSADAPTPEATPTG